MSITSFRKEYNFLSNFYKCKVEFEKIVYPSSEHAYQAQKCKNEKDKLQFIQGSAAQAKKLGQKINANSKWDEIKVNIMRNILKEKFKGELAQQLIKTYPEELIEGNTWNDRFWGQCPLGNGQNWLGKLLMELREELIKTGV